MSDSSDGKTPNAFPYPGAKSNLAPWIVEHLPDHRLFIDVFGGSADVILGKPPSHIEVYNDLDGDLVQFWTVLRDDLDALADVLNQTPYSRDVYQQWSHAWFNGTPTDDDVDRWDWTDGPRGGLRPEDPVKHATVFFYIRQGAFMSKLDRVSGFRSNPMWNCARTLRNATDELRQVQDRFHDVVIEHCDYADLFDKYDPDDDTRQATPEDTVFYMDPPYVDESYYPADPDFDHAALINTVDDLNAKWILSYRELPEAVDILDDIYVVAKDYQNQMNSPGVDRTDATERLLMNYDPDDADTQFVGKSQAQLGDY